MPLLRGWNVLCWNVRGLNSDDKQLALSNAIAISGCAIVCLQETKKTYLAFIKSCGPKRFDKFVFVPSRGASGGILTIWNTLVFSGEVLYSADFAQDIRFTNNTICSHLGQYWTYMAPAPVTTV